MTVDYAHGSRHNLQEFVFRVYSLQTILQRAKIKSDCLASGALIPLNAAFLPIVFECLYTARFIQALGADPPP